MLTAFGLAKTGPLKLGEGCQEPAPESAVWIDLLSPTKQEDEFTEHFLGVPIPTLEEAQEIEFSSRFYEENGGLFMTLSVLVGVEEGAPALSPLTFALSGKRLATIRYHEFRAFRQFLVRAKSTDGLTLDGQGVMLGLLEAIIDRLADVVERVGGEIDKVNHSVFRRRHEHRRKARGLEALVDEIGIRGDLVAKVRESLASLERLLQYATAEQSIFNAGRPKNRIKLMTRDVRSLADQIGFLSGKITFLLEATLGLIQVEQNEVVRILTVVSTFFFPPTLIGTVYGMNFQNMPELGWGFGYPLVLILMVISALVPFLYFKRRGWL